MVVTVTDPNPAPGDLRGQLCGSYKVYKLLGTGGMGQVWFARSIMLGGQPAAVKVLFRELSARPDILARFDNEVAAIGAIKDPNVVRAYEAGQLADGRRFMVMEFCERGSLAALLEEKGRLSFELTISIMIQAASALAAAHKLKIIHRDFKPGNILLDERDGQLIVKLADFGIAKLLDESLRAAGTHTNTSQVMGTAAYMAPEQAIAGMAVDHRIDVYAFGVVLYECVTGQRPYHGADGSVFEVMQSLAQRRPFQLPHELRPDIPRALEAVILGCLEHDPERRIQTIDEAARRAASSLRAGSALMQVVGTKFVDKATSPGEVTFAEGIGVGPSKLLNSASIAKARASRIRLARVAAIFVAGAIAGGGAVALVPRLAGSATDQRLDDPAARVAHEAHETSGGASASPSRVRVPEAVAGSPVTLDAGVAVAVAAPAAANSSAGAVASEPTRTALAPATPVAPTTPDLPAEGKTPRVPVAAGPSNPQIESKGSARGIAPPEPPRTQASPPTPMHVPVAQPQRPSRASVDDAQEVELHFIVRPFAEVTVDGEHRGTTPRDVTVKLGKHHVVLEGHVDGVNKRQEFDVNVTKEMTISRTW